MSMGQVGCLSSTSASLLRTVLGSHMDPQTLSRRYNIVMPLIGRKQIAQPITVFQCPLHEFMQLRGHHLEVTRPSAGH